MNEWNKTVVHLMSYYFAAKHHTHPWQTLCSSSSLALVPQSSARCNTISMPNCKCSTNL
jgi:hypothetical protein